MGKHLPAFRALVLLTSLLNAMTLAAPVTSAATIVLRAGASENKGTSPPAVDLDRLAELTKQYSDGQLEIQVYYQSLGIEQQLIQSVKMGSVDIGEIATSNVTRFTDAFLQFDLPFLFASDKAYIDVLENNPAGKQAVAQFEKDLGVKTLLLSSQTYDGKPGGTDLSTREKIAHVPADIKGLKLRTGSTPAEIVLMRAYGANPTPVDIAQLYSALQQGVVDGNVGTAGVVSYLAYKLNEIAPHYTAIGFRHNVNLIYINRRKFDSLSPSQQQALLKAAAQTEQEDGAVARQMVKDSLDHAETLGVHIYYPTKEEMAQWLSVRENVWQEIADQFKGKVDLKIADQIYNSAPH